MNSIACSLASSCCSLPSAPSAIAPAAVSSRSSAALQSRNQYNAVQSCQRCASAITIRCSGEGSCVHGKPSRANLPARTKTKTKAKASRVANAGGWYVVTLQCLLLLPFSTVALHCCLSGLQQLLIASLLRRPLVAQHLLRRLQLRL
jgi:hypothetical protein